MARRKRRHAGVVALLNILGGILLVVAAIMDFLVLIAHFLNMAILTQKIISVAAYLLIGFYIFAAEGLISKHKKISLDTRDAAVMLIIAILVLVIYVVFSGNLFAAVAGLLFILSAIVLIL